MNGIYAMFYTGTMGSGHAIFVMKDGLITGADVTGGVLDGTYETAGDSGIRISVTLTVPAGTWLVTGVAAGQEALTQTITSLLPVNFANGNAIPLMTPTGPINVVFKKLRDIQ